MCGRFTLRTPAQDIAQHFEVTVPDLSPRYNIAPSQEVAAVRFHEKQREFAFLRWGLVPFWADDPKTGYKMINARAETVAQKPSFRQAFKSRRCLIVADGFFEWQKSNGHKQPFYFHRKDEEPFAFAGLWEHWEGAGEEIQSCTILVTEANELVGPIHDRMPVILSPQNYDLWLDPKAGTQERLQNLLRPASSEEMEVYPVKTVMNNPKNDMEECIERMSE